MGVAFWNLVGAGVFGFLINPPIALYYMQGLNTTPLHGHAALFGVYGLLSLDLILGGAAPAATGRTMARRTAASGLLGHECGAGADDRPEPAAHRPGTSLGQHDPGVWYARSAEFLQQPILEWLRWLQIVGDTVFIVGVGALAWFVIGLKTGWSYVVRTLPVPQAAAKPAQAVLMNKS